MSQGSTRRPGSSGGSSRSAHQRPLRATQTFSQHGGSAASQSAAPATGPTNSGADWSSASSSRKRPSPSSSPFSFRVSSSPDPNSRSRSPGSPGGSTTAKSNVAKIRRSPGASPVPLVRQSPLHASGDREMDTGDVGSAGSSWRSSRPSSIDMVDCGFDSGAGGCSAQGCPAGFIVAGSPNAFARLPRANSRASVGSVSSELDALVLGTPSGELLEMTLDGRRPPVVHLVSRHGSTPNVFTSSGGSGSGRGSAVSPKLATPSPTCRAATAAAAAGGGGDASAYDTTTAAPHFSPSPQQYQLSRRSSNEFESPVPHLPAIVPFVSTAVRFGSTQIHVTTANPIEQGPIVRAFAVPDLSKEGPDPGKVNLTVSQSSVFQQCVRAGQ